MTGNSYGTKLDGIDYRDRKGAYAIIIEGNKTAVIKQLGKYFLLGGGIECGESDEECIKRECIEECGFDIEVGSYLGTRDNYSYSPYLKEHLHSIGYFYFGTLKDKVAEPIELDHELVWLSVSDAMENLMLPQQRWALKTALSALGYRL